MRENEVQLDKQTIEKIGDFYGAYYDPVAEKFLETNDHGVLGDEDDSANAALRGARFAVETIAPRPVIDREVLDVADEVLAVDYDDERVHQLARAVKLARPVPARKRIITALARAEGRTITWQSAEWRHMAEETFGFRADAVLALLNGSES